MTKKTLKICFFHLAFIYSGGGERLVMQEMEGLRKRGHQVVCYVPLLDKKKCFPDLIGSYDIRLILPVWLRKIIPRSSLAIILSFFWLFLKLSELSEFDVFIGANQPGPLYCWLVTRFLKKPYLVYLAQPTRILYPRRIDKEAGLWFRGRFLLLPFLAHWLQPLIIWLDRISVQKADKMLVNGKYMLSILEQIYGREGICCPAGSAFTRAAKVNKWKGKVDSIAKPFIFLSNRHVPQKRFEWAIEIISKIKNQKSKIILVISGSLTGYTDQLKKIVKKRKLEDRVIFTGYVEDRDLARLYRHAALYVYPAPEEDFGMGLIEAMGSGTAVVGWNAGGPTGTVVSDETGILVEPYNFDKFAQAMKKLIFDKNLNRKMAEKATGHIRENFTVEKHIDILEKYLITNF